MASIEEPTNESDYALAENNGMATGFGGDRDAGERTDEADRRTETFAGTMIFNSALPFFTDRSRESGLNNAAN